MAYFGDMSTARICSMVSEQKSVAFEEIGPYIFISTPAKPLPSMLNSGGFFLVIGA
jgi:hypothetical protein